MAILRTVENGVPLARCANNGISMVVDQYGRILKETQLFEAGFVFCRIAVDDERTVYYRYGYIYPLLSLILITGFLVRRLLMNYWK